MLNRRTFVTGALALAGGRALGAGLPPVPFDDLQGLIDTAAQQARRQHGANLAVVLGVVGPRGGGRLMFAGGDGLANPAGRPLQLNGATPFEIGSIAKVFTSAVHYHRHGPFEGNLGRWLAPRRLSAGIAGIALADLARYQPGLPQDNHGAVVPPGTMQNFGALFRYLATARPAFPPGTCYSYSNLGWSLLAMAGSAAGRGDAEAFADRYDRALKEFCSGIGARQTGIFRPQMKPRLPLAYRRGWHALPSGADYRPTFLAGVGSGGIVSTGGDMLAFLRHAMGLGEGGLTDPALAYQQGPVFAAQNCAGGRAPRTAYGWILNDVPGPGGPTTLLAKDGAVAGFTAWMGFVGWQGTGAPSPYGVFVLCNGPPAAGLGLRAMRRILGG